MTSYPTAGRIIALDVGTKRVGMAIADPLHLFAQPVGTFSPAAAVEKLERILEEDGIRLLVVGWPLTEAGEEGWATERVQEYINRLEKRLKNVSVVKQDERYTSESAKESIKQGERPAMGRRSKGRIDTAAAGIILQDYLDEARRDS